MFPELTIDSYINVTPDGGIKKKVITEGQGSLVTENQEVGVKYCGNLKDQIFDQTYKEPFRYTIGNHEVALCWEIAAKTMKLGEKSEFIIEPKYGYLSLPNEKSKLPNFTITLEIEIVEINPPSKKLCDMNIFERIDKAKNFKIGGVEKFVEKDIEWAMEKFERAVYFIEDIKLENIDNKGFIKDRIMNDSLEIINENNNEIQKNGSGLNMEEENKCEEDKEEIENCKDNEIKSISFGNHKIKVNDKENKEENKEDNNEENKEDNIEDNKEENKVDNKENNKEDNKEDNKEENKEDNKEDNKVDNIEDNKEENKVDNIEDNKEENKVDNIEDNIEDNIINTDKKSIKEAFKESQELLITLYTNLANCENHMKNYAKVLIYTSLGLKLRKTPKLYYFKTIAEVYSHQLDKAIESFKELKNLFKEGDKGIDFVKNLIEKKKEEREIREKKFMRSIPRQILLESKDVKQSINPPKEINPLNPIVYMNIKIGEKINKIKIELFKNIVPKTSENFRCLCTGEKGDNLNYKGKIFDKLIKNFIIQGGKIDKENNISIYGKNFENENYYYSHSREGLLSMANKSYDSNGSEFFITLKDSIWLDGKNVVFGQIIEGINIIKEFNNIEIDNNDTPKIPIIIDDCGEILKNNI